MAHKGGSGLKIETEQLYLMTNVISGTCSLQLASFQTADSIHYLKEYQIVLTYVFYF